MGGGEGGASQNYPCFKFIIFMDSVKSSPAFLKSQFETLHICYRCSEKEHVPFQIGKNTFDKITVLSNVGPANQCPRNRFAA